MCGIVGVISTRDVSGVLLEGLRRLEYRGYDSAGLATINSDAQLHVLKAQGKVNALAAEIDNTPIPGNLGIAHTRWATHGKPCKQNAHPLATENKLAIVHNGIIENHTDLRTKLEQKGYVFTSETDTEVALHLIADHYKQQPRLLDAVHAAVQELKGAFALAVVHVDEPNTLIAARNGCPLVVGFGIQEHFIASDPLALRSFAQSIIFLEEGDIACLSKDTVSLYDASKKPLQREKQSLGDDYHAVSKGSYRHFMLKEIFEQEKVLTDTLEGRVASLEVLRASFGEVARGAFDAITGIHIIACGTSYHAGLVAKYWLESLAKLPTQVEIASEYRYRDVVVPTGTLFITVSQSGETADTLAALSKAKKLDYVARFAICNVGTSSLVRESDAAFLTRAGVEIGVASTKAFTTQLAVFLMLAIALCQDDSANEAFEQLKQLPAQCAKILQTSANIKRLAYQFSNKEHALFLGRGVQYPIALEGALKLKELSYIHAEAYPAGELKHGPLALVDENMPVVAVAPNDELLGKLRSNLEEVGARGGQLFVFVDESENWTAEHTTIIPLPSCSHWIAPIVYTIPLQLLAYHVAVAKGTDVDQPRNLAKSVTVE